MLYIILLIVIFVVCIYFTHTDTVYVVSSVDNNSYIIQKNNEYMMLESANALAEINKRVQKLIEYLNEKYENDFTKMYFIKKLNSFSHRSLSEAVIDKRYTTYTIDKKDMYVCLRTRDARKKIYDINLLMYVVLHELAHMCNYDYNGNAIIGHGNEFKNIFKFLILQSIKLGVYQYENYHEKPKEYCGIVVNTSIVSDDDVD